MGTLAVDNIQHTDGSSAVTLNNATITAGTIPAAGITGTLGSGVTFPAGIVLQSKTTELKDPWSWTNTTANTDGTSSSRADDSYGGILTGLTTTVTAKGADSDFLVSWS